MSDSISALMRSTPQRFADGHYRACDRQALPLKGCPPRTQPDTE
ncbi:hypothetical protein [Microcoleus vaginatus]